jgi:cyclopropane fatty-acyl-phospholipid synthase-like methyltransferase
MFDISLYNDDFFKWHLVHAREYSMDSMDWYIKTYKPKSVIDFGCGIGSYLESAFLHKLKIRGYDIGGEYAKRFTPKFLHEHIIYQDCTLPISEEKYDCVISIETIEHIEPSGTDVFLQNIVNAVNENGKILFTAAPPEQDGCGHINCYPKEYWLEKFKNLGFFENEKMCNEVKEKWVKFNNPNYIINNLIILERN